MLSVKRYPQISETHCGPATLQMLLSAHGRYFDQHQLTKAGGAEKSITQYGMRPDQMVRAVHALCPDLQFYFKENATLSDLDILIHHYHWPVGVNWQNLFYDTEREEQEEDPNGDHGHYVVLVDLNLKPETVSILDPYYEFPDSPRTFAYPWFESRWWDRALTPIINSQTGSPRWLYTRRFIFLIASPKVVFPKELQLVSSAQIGKLYQPEPHAYDGV